MRRRLKGLLANLALLIASLVVVLGLLEALARFAHYRRGGGKEADERSRYIQRDPLLGWSKRPGAGARFERREYTVEVAINGQGLRDPERSSSKPPGGFRILALGDSFIEAYSVPLEASVTQRLEATLARPGCPIEVLNGGTSGWSTDQEYLYYTRDGVRFQPDVVLLFFFYNDVVPNTWDRYFGSPKPLLAWRDGQLVLTHDPVPVPPPAPPPAAPASDPPPTLHGSAALHWVADRLMRGAPRAFNALAGLRLWDRLGDDEIDEQLLVYKRRRLPPIEAAWGLTHRILAGLAEAVQTHGSRFAVVYIPNRMEVSDRDWELTRLRFNFNRHWDRGLVLEQLRKIGRHERFPVVDLTPALRAANHGLLGEPYYLYDGHWNATGHAAAASEVERFLRAERWLPACAGS